MSTTLKVIFLSLFFILYDCQLWFCVMKSRLIYNGKTAIWIKKWTIMNMHFNILRGFREFGTKSLADIFKNIFSKSLNEFRIRTTCLSSLNQISIFIWILMSNHTQWSWIFNKVTLIQDFSSLLKHLTSSVKMENQSLEVINVK